MELCQPVSRSTTTNHIPPRKHMPWIKSPLNLMVQWSSSDTSGRTEPRNGGSGTPIFREQHEADSIELFYDLFFVANLATFTANHKIENSQTLGSYIGFFTLLWFTWLQTSLYDVRFSTDSVFSRIFKLLSFGVMTGFAVAAPLFDTSEEGYVPACFRSLSLMLMASRLFLVIQYAMVLWFVKEHKKTFVPLALTMAMLFTSAIVFFSLFFAFTDESSNGSYIGWYAVLFVEAIVVVIVSSLWHVLNFKHTHLVERNGLLTLIIMGEGVLGLTKSVAKIVTKTGNVTGSDLGTIVAGVFLIFFLWVLYFDQIESGKFGTIRVQIWTLLHFPLHVAILLTEEGSSKFIVWWTLVEKYPDTSALQEYLNLTISGTNGTATPEVLNKKSALLRHPASPKHSSLATLNPAPIFAEICDLKSTWEGNVTKMLHLVDEIRNSILKDVSATSGVISAAPIVRGLDEPIQIPEFITLFDTVFYFFFVAAGCVLISLGVLYWCGKKHKTWGEIASIVTRIVAGISLGLVAVIHQNTVAFKNYILSPWLIPTVVLTFFVVIVADNYLIWHTNRIVLQQILNIRSAMQASA